MTKPPLRLWGDYNNGDRIWTLRLDGRLIDEIVGELGLYEGMPVTVWDDGGDPDDLMEMDGVMVFATDFDRWIAELNPSTLRRLGSQRHTS
jgi:hypothetical protein